jgi:hypothetical protein
MTVLEPTPERPARWGWLRRAAFVGSALALTFAFAVSLSGIATTEGQVRPDGQAAAIAAQHTSRGSDTTEHRDCHRRGRGASRRV